MKKEDEWLSDYTTRVNGLITFYVIAFAILYAAGKYNYLLFHSLAELIAIISMWGVFMITWNTRKVMKNGFLLFLGVSFLFVATVDLFHTLAYKGLGVFSEPGANAATQLWIAGRYISAVSWVIAPFLIKKSLWLPTILISYGSAALLVILSILIWKVFPVAYIDGYGQTFFKIISEYIVSALYLFSAYLIYRKRDEFNKNIYYLIVASLGVTIISEFMFALYVSVYAFSNFLGHYLRIIAYSLIYEAFIAAGLQKPYSLLFLNLRRSEQAVRKEHDKLRAYLNLANVIFVVIEKDQAVSLVNKKGCQLLGYGEEEIVGKNWFDNFVPSSIRTHMKQVFNKTISGELSSFEYFEHAVATKSGEERIIAWHNALYRDENGVIQRAMSAGEDITDYKIFQKQIHTLNVELLRLREKRDRSSAALGGP